MPEESKSKRTYFMPNINKVMITCNLAKEVNVKYQPDGRCVCNLFAIANKRYKDKEGNWKDGNPTSVSITAWGQLGERVGETLKVGDSILVEGRLETSSWETPDGQKRSKTFITADKIQKIGTALKETEEEKSKPEDVPEGL